MNSDYVQFPENDNVIIIKDVIHKNFKNNSSINKNDEPKNNNVKKNKKDKKNKFMFYCIPNIF